METLLLNGRDTARLHPKTVTPYNKTYVDINKGGAIVTF